MLRSVHKYLLQFFVTFCMAACAGVSEIGNPSEGDSNFISFNVSETMTKVSDDDIKDHLLCIYIYDEGNVLGGRDWSKYRLKYDSSSECWRFWNTSASSFEDIEWGTGEHEFFAYNEVNYYWGMYSDPHYQSSFNFVYNGASSAISASSAINMLYPTDGGARQGCNQDLIYASATRDVENDGYGSVSLEFDHALASLLIEVKNNSNSNKDITICSLRDVILEGTNNPTLRFADGKLTANLGSAVNTGIAFEGGTVLPGESFIATGGPVVIWPQAIENQWLELSISGVSNIVKNMDSDFGTTSWEAGKRYHYIVNIPSPVVLGSPSASISHTMTDGVLTGSAVTLNLGGATDEQLKKIKGLTVNVKRDGTDGTIYKTYSAGDDVVASSNTISISSGDRNYLPQGTYTVECSYMSGLDEVSFTITDVISELEPTELGLTYTVTANADTPGKLTVTDASVNISQSVLDELSLPKISLNFAADGGNSYEVKDISLVSLGADFTPVETEVVAGVYNLTSSMTFDGVELETDDTYTVPGVGWYVNNDGTFSETFISDYSIAKIFYLGSLLTDTQLVTDHSYCTLGLAYEVDPDAGAMVCNSYYDTWSSGSTSIVNWDNQYDYTSEQNIHGYSNTYAIKACADKGYMTQIDLNTAVVPGKTSPWYIPSIGELKSMTDIPSTNNDLWTSTIDSFTNITKTIDSAFYRCNTQEKKKQTTGSYYKYYIRILAF